MAVREGQNAGNVESRGTTGGESAAAESTAAPPRGCDAELASEVEPRTRKWLAARRSEQAGRRRGIGSLEVR